MTWTKSIVKSMVSARLRQHNYQGAIGCILNYVYSNHAHDADAHNFMHSFVSKRGLRFTPDAAYCWHDRYGIPADALDIQKLLRAALAA